MFFGLHKKIAYFDYAATSPVRSEVLEVYNEASQKYWGNASSIHQTGRQAKNTLNEAREKIASLLNCAPTEIIFTSSGSEGNNLALKGFFEAKNWRGKFALSPIEHSSVLNTAEYLKTKGVRVIFLPINFEGLLTEQARIIIEDEKFDLVSVMLANNEIGTINPIGDLALTVHSYGGVFHTDAVQAVGLMDLDFKKIGADIITLAGHKFGAPKGIGILYVKEGIILTPQILGGNQEWQKRAGTENVPAILALAKALEIATEERAQHISKLENFQKQIMASVEKIDGVKITGSKKYRLVNNVSLSIEAVEGENVVLHLSQKGIETSSGSACTSGDIKPSHVLLACGLSEKSALGSLRISMGFNTTQEEVDSLYELLPKTITEVQKLTPITNPTNNN